MRHVLHLHKGGANLMKEVQSLVHLKQMCERPEQIKRNLSKKIVQMTIEVMLLVFIQL